MPLFHTVGSAVGRTDWLPRWLAEPISSVISPAHSSVVVAGARAVYQRFAFISVYFSPSCGMNNPRRWPTHLRAAFTPGQRRGFSTPGPYSRITFLAALPRTPDRPNPRTTYDLPLEAEVELLAPCTECRLIFWADRGIIYLYIHVAYSHKRGESETTLTQVRDWHHSEWCFFL